MERAGLQVVQFFRLFGEFVPKLGMGDADQRLGALADGLAVQFRHAEFSDDEAHVIARGDNARAVFEQRCDLAKAISVSRADGARQGNDRDAVLGA